MGIQAHKQGQSWVKKKKKTGGTTRNRTTGKREIRWFKCKIQRQQSMSAPGVIQDTIPGKEEGTWQIQTEHQAHALAVPPSPWLAAQPDLPIGCLAKPCNCPNGYASWTHLALPPTPTGPARWRLEEAIRLQTGSMLHSSSEQTAGSPYSVTLLSP